MAQPDTIKDMPKEAEKFAEKLGSAVAQYVGTQRELARQVGIASQTLSKYLRGSVPKPGTTYALARELNVSLLWLLNDDADPTIEPPPFEDAALIRERMNERYHADLSTFQSMIETASKVPWQKIAVGVLVGSRFESKGWKPTEFELHACKLVTQLWPLYERLIESYPFSIEPGPDWFISPPLFHGQLERLHNRHVGIAALKHYLLRADVHWKIREWCDLADTATTADVEHFRNYGEPFWLSHLLTHEDLKGHELNDKLIPELKQQGYISKDGKPVIAIEVGVAVESGDWPAPWYEECEEDTK